MRIKKIRQKTWVMRNKKTGHLNLDGSRGTGQMPFFYSERQAARPCMEGWEYVPVDAEITIPDPPFKFEGRASIAVHGPSGEVINSYDTKLPCFWPPGCSYDSPSYEYVPVKVTVEEIVEPEPNDGKPRQDEKGAWVCTFTETPPTESKRIRRCGLCGSERQQMTDIKSHTGGIRVLCSPCLTDIDNYLQ